MDAITTSVITILGKYALDKGADLAREAGPTAKEAAGRLFDKVIDYLRKKPETKVIAEGYEKNPEGYQKPLEDQVETAVQEDAALRAELEKLVAEYEKAKESFQGSTQVSVSGGAAAVGSDNVAVGERGVYAKGGVKGNITTGDTGKRPISREETTADE